MTLKKIGSIQIRKLKGGFGNMFNKKKDVRKENTSKKPRTLLDDLYIYLTGASGDMRA